MSLYLLTLNGNKDHTIEIDSRKRKDELVEELRAKGNTVDVKNVSPVLLSRRKENGNGD